MARPHLSCTVRGCGLPLEPRDRALACAAGHTFDIARSGYVNLLQPHDRRSLASGDTPAVVQARARLLAAGVGRAAIEDLARRAGDRAAGGESTVVDLGSGSGELLAAITMARHVEAIGIDISAAAAEHSAKRYPHITWLVANADRRLPLIDRSVQVVLSLHARRNPEECARVLAPDGALLIAVPALDDLIELRAEIGGARVERERTAAVVAEHLPRFALVDRAAVRERHRLEPSLLRDLLRVTYRGERTSESARVEALEGLDVTVASEILHFVRRDIGVRERDHSGG